MLLSLIYEAFIGARRTNIFLYYIIKCKKTVLFFSKISLICKTIRSELVQLRITKRKTIFSIVNADLRTSFLDTTGRVLQEGS